MTDPNRASDQATPSRGYGPKGTDGTHQDVDDAAAAETSEAPDETPTAPDEMDVESKDDPDAGAER